MTSLYVHIPFCVRHCEYCDFYSEVASERDIDAYLNALEREFRLRFAGGLAPETIFVGGGTPTRLSAPQLRRFGEIMARYVDASRLNEFTIEINPGTLDAEKATALASMGVTRASFGVQSFNEAYLKSLGRIHEAGKAAEAVSLVRAAGIKRTSIDLIFALPGQTLDQVKSDIARALELGTEHLSFYALTFEDDTPLTRDLLAGRVQPCDEELEREMFTVIGETCAAAGLERYEVSNFAKPNAECRHNFGYWTLGDWHGVGAAAHGMVGGEITENAADYRAYGRALLEENKLPIVRREQLGPMQRAETLLLMGLRLKRGVELAQFERLAGQSFVETCGEAAVALTGQGLIEVSPTYVRCTDEGLLVLDRVVLELASFASSGAAK
jgi:oxygen-independent coproporphyrinogen-3 oxidase